MRWSSLAVILILAIFWLPAIPNAYSADYRPYTDAELDQLLAPIALYPDPLLAQILPAASFGDQIYRASSMLDGHVDEGLIEIQSWDISVKALAHYPNILTFMAQNVDWTAAVGQAYVTQRRGVERSIQRLREQARAAGYLQSTDEQQVLVNNDVISIEPAQADVIYVPQYDPAYVWGYSDLYPFYGYPAYSYGGLGFGAGLFIGPWLNRDWDWFGAGPYYHGWRGRGWVGRSRQFVDTRNRTYVNDQFRNVHVNHDVINRNTGDVRERMDRNAGVARAKPQVNPPAAVAPPAPGAAPPSHVQTPPAPGATPTPRAVTPPAPAATPAPRPVTPPPTAVTPPSHVVTPPAPAAPPPTPRPVTPPPTAVTPPSHVVTPPAPAAPPPVPRPVTPPPTAVTPPSHVITPPAQAAPPPAPRPVPPPPAAVTPPSHVITPPAPAAPPPAPRPVTPPPAAVTPPSHVITPPPAAPVPHAAPPPVAPPHPAPPHAAPPPGPPPHAAPPPPPPASQGRHP